MIHCMKCVWPVVLFMMAAAVSCKGNDNPEKGPVKIDDAKAGDPISVVDGKVRFFVGIADHAPRVCAGVSKTTLLDNAEYLYVNGTKYSLAADDSGNLYADVMENAEGSYNASLSFTGSSKWFGSNPTIDLKVPYGQVYDGSSLNSALLRFPMCGEYSESTGNMLMMSDNFGLVDLKIAGSVSVASVKIQAEDKELSGVFLNTAEGYVSKGQSSDFVVLNCTNKGEFVGGGNDFCLMVAPGSNGKAVVTICDATRKVMTTDIDLNVEAGQILSKTIEYKPDEDVLFYEGFDLCTWGGNVMGGSGSFGLSPSSATVSSTSSADLTGEEVGLSAVAYNVAGTGFIQPDVWNDVNGKNVGKVHRMSDSYIVSRNFADFAYLFRVQEFPGMVGVSYNVTTRGILCTPNFSNVDGFRKVKITMRFCPLAGLNDNLLVAVEDGGFVTEASLDGQKLSQDAITYVGNAGNLVLGNSAIEIPASMTAANRWQTVELIVDKATDGTRLHVCGNSSASGNHGFFVDSIVVTDLGEAMERSSLRVLYWNIQNGMWSDQANEFENFIKWVKRYEPDICVWCEAASIYKDGTSVSALLEDRRLPDGWAEVAKQYGHNYSALGGHRDNYPQEITSKYPITTLLKITDTDDEKKPISHGAAIQQVNVNGKILNIVTLHTWPQSYAYGVVSADREASTAENGGDKYREYEIKYILEHTVNASEYSSQTDWLMMGDFNSRSIVDNWYYKLAESSTAFLCQNAIKEGCDMVDIIGTKYPGMLISSTGGNSRIDYMYASPSMYTKVKNAVTVIDSFTSNHKDDMFGTSFYHPSDHRPILVDFEF